MNRSATKLQDTLAYPPRAMRAEQAAAYLSISRTAFLELVDEGVMPQPVRIRSMTTWDRIELDAAYEDLKTTGENTFHRRLKEIRDEKRREAKGQGH